VQLTVLAKFCPECGTSLTPTATTDTKTGGSDSGSVPILERETGEETREGSPRKRAILGGIVCLVVLAVIGLVVSSNNDGSPTARDSAKTSGSLVTDAQIQCAATWNRAEIARAQHRAPLSLQLGVILQSSAVSQGGFNDSLEQQGSAADALISNAKVSVSTEDQRSQNCIVTILYDQFNKAAQQDTGSLSGIEFYQYQLPKDWTDASDPYGDALKQMGPFPESEIYDSIRRDLDSSPFHLAADSSPYVAGTSLLSIEKLSEKSSAPDSAGGLSPSPPTTPAVNGLIVPEMSVPEGYLDCGGGEGMISLVVKGLDRSNCIGIIDQYSERPQGFNIGTLRLACSSKKEILLSNPDPDTGSQKPVEFMHFDCKTSDGTKDLQYWSYS